jgi:hypothetical protein
MQDVCRQPCVIGQVGDSTMRAIRRVWGLRMVGGEEFEEAIGGFLAAGRNQGRSAISEYGDELIHVVCGTARSLMMRKR